MRYAKCLDGIYVSCIGTRFSGTEITESEYNDLLSIIHNRPTPSTGFTYKLKADTLEWELVELPPIDETDDEATESDYIDALKEVGIDIN